jgi:hypothetical protein
MDFRRKCIGILVVGLLLLYAGDLWASCVLTGCPIERRSGPHEDPTRGLVDATTFFGSYSPETSEYQYWTTNVRGEVVFLPWLRGSLSIPVATVSHEETTSFGLSDISMELAFVPFRWNHDRSKILFSSQFEVPTGDEEAHLGSGHAEWLPYAAFHTMVRRTMMYVQGGWRTSFGSDDHSSSHGSAIDPHTGNELVYRLGGVVPLPSAFSAGLARYNVSVSLAGSKLWGYRSTLAFVSWRSTPDAGPAI